MNEEISLTSWIRGKLTGPVPAMPEETLGKVLSFFKEILAVKRTGKGFGVHIAHLRDLGEDDEAEMFEAFEEIDVQAIEKVIADLENA